MSVFAIFLWVASFSRAAVFRDRGQNLIRRYSDSQAVSRRSAANVSGSVNSTHNVKSANQPLPMNICPLGGIVPDQEQIKRAAAAGAVHPGRELIEQKAKGGTLSNVVQSGVKFSQAAPNAQQTPKSQNMVEHEYVFITGLPYTGTTTLYGLLSTSPQTSNLCKGGGNCCEGAPVLVKAGLWPVRQALNPAFPADWNQALAVYSNYWNMSKPILVEKSVNNMKRFPRLYQTLRSTGAKASFIYVVRSTCFFRHNQWGPNGWVAGMNELLQSAQYMRSVGAKVLIVKWEDMVGDPYAVAQDLVNFLPALESLDPTKNGLHDAPYVTLEQPVSTSTNVIKTTRDIRAVPAATYSTNIVKVQAVYQGKPMSPWEQQLMPALGYTREWFEKTSWLKWGPSFQIKDKPLSNIRQILR